MCFWNIPDGPTEKCARIFNDFVNCILRFRVLRTLELPVLQGLFIKRAQNKQI